MTTPQILDRDGAVDHVRRRRQARLDSTYATAAQNRQTCRDSLRVIGGACSDGRRP